MAEVLSIAGKTRPEEILAGIIETLEDWLNEAKQGNIKALLLCGIEDGKKFRISVPACDHTLELLGAVEFAKIDLINSQDDD